MLCENNTELSLSADQKAIYKADLHLETFVLQSFFTFMVRLYNNFSFLHDPGL